MVFFVFCPLVQLIASHIIKVHASAGAASKDNDSLEGENWLKRYNTVPLLSTDHQAAFPNTHVF